MCARGYSDQMAGLASSSFMLSGCIASLPVSVIATKTQKSLQMSKMFLIIGLVGVASQAYVLNIPDHPELVITINVITAIFTIR